MVMPTSAKRMRSEYHAIVIVSKVLQCVLKLRRLYEKDAQHRATTLKDALNV